MDEKLSDMIKQLQSARDQCLRAKVAVHELGQKYAPLCIQLLLEMRHVPKLINNRIENRARETGGLDVIHPDFWDADMLIALAEYFDSMENVNACA